MMAMNRTQTGVIGRGMAATLERVNERTLTIMLTVTVAGVSNTPHNTEQVTKLAAQQLQQVGMVVVETDIDVQMARMQTRIAHLEAQLAQARETINEGGLVVSRTPRPVSWVSVAVACKALAVSQATISRAKQDGRINYREVKGGGSQKPRYEVDCSSYRPASRKGKCRD